MTDDFPDWRPAPNIGRHPDIYELENEAIARDGRLDQALLRLADWTGRDLLDIGSGTGFWLPRYAQLAARVEGVEPDPNLCEQWDKRASGGTDATMRLGSAEHLPYDDDTFDVVHARFAYFFGPGSEAGLHEVGRVLRPDGTFIAIDNSWSGGDFARLLEIATEGNAAIDPDKTARWWAERGATRHEVEAGWSCKTPQELETILRIEFASDVVETFLDEHHDGGSEISYRYALWTWTP